MLTADKGCVRFAGSLLFSVEVLNHTCWLIVTEQTGCGLQQEKSNLMKSYQVRVRDRNAFHPCLCGRGKSGRLLFVLSFLSGVQHKNTQDEQLRLSGIQALTRHVCFDFWHFHACPPFWKEPRLFKRVIIGLDVWLKMCSRCAQINPPTWTKSRVTGL